MKQTFIPIMLLVVGLIILGGCTEESEESEESKFYGTWKVEESPFRMFEFLPNRTCLINIEGHAGTWSIVNGTITIIDTAYGGSTTYYYAFSPYNKKLTLTEADDEFGFGEIYVKQ
jgi:hypothetical protein